MTRCRQTSRREFLKQGVAGMAVAALLPGCADPRSSRQPQAVGGPPVRRTLGRTGLELPIVSMGSTYAVNLVRSALDEGIVYIHTSSSYAERNHERLLGEVFRDRPRDSFVIATSPDLPYRPSRGRGRSLDVGMDADPERIVASLTDSLRRLGLDHVDIYYLPSIGSREATLYQPYMKAYERLKSAGLTRFVGVATHENEPEVIRAAAGSGFWDVALTAYNFRQSHREQVRSAIGEAAAAGLGVVAMKTQAGVYWDRARRRKINMRAALKWVLQDANVHTTIPAFSSFEEMREDLLVMRNPTLTPAEERDLELAGGPDHSGLFCQQCGRCREQCPAALDIPTLMRAHMYAVGHGAPERARDILRAWASTEIACRQCAQCEVQCALGLDVRGGATTMARLLDTPYRTRTSFRVS